MKYRNLFVLTFVLFIDGIWNITEMLPLHCECVDVDVSYDVYACCSAFSNFKSLTATRLSLIAILWKVNLHNESAWVRLVGAAWENENIYVTLMDAYESNRSMNERNITDFSVLMDRYIII